MELAFLGDIALFGCNTTGSDYKKKFAPVKDILSRYEYVIGNLETPLTDTNKPVGGKSAYLKSSPSNVEILQYLGVTHLSLANNHTFDYRRKGLDDTVKSLDANGIEWYGAYSKSVPIDDGETRVMLHGFCCYSSNGKGLSEDGNGVNVLNPMKIEQDIENDICKGYYPVLSCHWGQEHVHYANYDHVRLFRTLSDKYDILIHGHHPHVIQGIEKIKNSLCAYSLGNFCFDDVYTKKSDKPLIKLSDDNKQSFILSVEIIGNEIKAFEQIPFTFTDDEYKTDDGCTKGKIDEWNLFLNTDRFEYNQKRREDLNRYLNERKTLRNIKWYIKRLNFESVGIILVNKENQARYNELVLKYINKSTSVTERQDKILICGNFSMAEMNAAGKRVYGVGCVYRELGYEVVLAGVDKKRTGSICESRRQIKGFTNFAFRAAVSGRGWLRVWENYNELISVINEIGIDGLKCIYFYGSPVVAVWIKKVIAFARKNKIRTVFDCVDWIEKTGGGKLRNIIKYIDTNYMKRIVAKKTDGIVTISSWLRDYYFKSSGNVIIIPPLCAYGENVGATNEIPRLAYAGVPFKPGTVVQNVNDIKDRIDVSVRLLAEVKKQGCCFMFHIFGFTEVEFINSLPTLEESVKILGNSIMFRGMLPMHEIQKELSDFDYTFLVRDVTKVTTAGFPTKVSESISLGVPVITTRTSDICEYLKEDSEVFLIDTSNFEEAVKKLGTILRIPIDIRQNNKKSCLMNKCFSYETYKDKVRAFMSSVDNR